MTPARGSRWRNRRSGRLATVNRTYETKIGWFVEYRYDEAVREDTYTVAARAPKGRFIRLFEEVTK